MWATQQAAKDSTSVETKLDEYEVNYRINRRRDSLCSHDTVYLAPKDVKAPLSSLTAVLTSSKFSAEIAQRACFCAFDMASSSTTAEGVLSGCGENEAGGGGGAV